MTASQRMWKREQERKRRERLRRSRRRRNCVIIVIILAIIAVIAVVMINRGEDTKKAEKTYTPAPVLVQSDSKEVTDPYTTTREADDIKTSFFNNSAFAGNALAQTIGMYGILDDADFYAAVNADLENVYKLTPNGSTTSIAEQFKSKRFDKVFLSFGENELTKLSSSEFKNQYKSLIEKIEKYQPSARIYLIGMPPVTADTSSSNESINMKKIQDFNKRIASLAADRELYYIDSVSALGDNKDFLPSGVSADGINLNKAAVIDLLYYSSKKAYIPSSEDVASLSEDDEEDEDEDSDGNVKATVAPKSTIAPSPSPTVNVFKDSFTDKSKKSE